MFLLSISLCSMKCLSLEKEETASLFYVYSKFLLLVCAADLFAFSYFCLKATYGKKALFFPTNGLNPLVENHLEISLVIFLEATSAAYADQLQGFHGWKLGRELLWGLVMGNS